MADVNQIGVIGCGKMARRHLKAMVQLDMADRFFLYDTSFARAQELAADFEPRAEAAKTLDHVLDSEDINGVLVLTPTPSHADLVIGSLNAGNVVFCEKPLALSELEVQRIASAEVEAQRVFGNTETGTAPSRLMVGYIYRYMPNMQDAKQIIDSEALGDLHTAFFRLGGRGGAAEWKHRRGSGGGALLEMSVHQLDMAQWLFGDISLEAVLEHKLVMPTRLIGTHRVEADAEDLVLMRIQGANRVLILLQSDLITPRFMQWIEIQGDNGALFCSILDHLPSFVDLFEGRHGLNAGRTTIQAKESAQRETPHVRQMRDFARLLRGEHVKVPSSNGSLAIARMVDSIRQIL